MLDAINAAPTATSQSILATHKNSAGNNICADCGSENVDWASASRGVTLCENCAGIHRKIGVQYSVVRSLSLDDWPEQLLEKFISFGGNRKINAILESNLPENLKNTRNFVNKDIGLNSSSNAPPLPPKNSASGDRLFDVAISRCRMDGFNRLEFIQQKYVEFFYVCESLKEKLEQFNL
mmetsp:Transcript_2669/g.4340  ORF Transcript_2669/g.4340 Transcript_2669/m.4340 type:complete len:179 (-) Transcript_2669:24-560(-)